MNPISERRSINTGTLAILGRPNVGKSTLFNRIVGNRRAIVGDEPGITRDRLYARAHWNGREFQVVDTGGIIPDDKELIPAEIYRQARVALEEADVTVMVVDGRTELASPDIDLARLLLRSGKPVLLAVNKIDAAKLETSAGEFHRLGIKDLFPVSAEHGNGVGDLLDAALERMPKTEQPQEPLSEVEEPPVVPEASRQSAETKIAIIGRPNVGKSTLLNQLTGTSRAIVSPVAGTTRDAVDELVERGGESYRFIDTAGIRRKGKTKLMAEKLSVVMARKHLEAGDVALLVIDAVEGVTALDATIGGYAHESGRSVVIVVNKWDLVAGKDHYRPADQAVYENQIRSALKFLAYAPVLFVSASSGKNVDRVFSTVQRIARERRKRISTGEMNRFLKSVDFERASSPGGDLRIQYMTQAAVAPPTFVVFTNRSGKLHFSYQRFLENQIRRAFGFEGTPIWIKTRGKES